MKQGHPPSPPGCPAPVRARLLAARPRWPAGLAWLAAALLLVTGCRAADRRAPDPTHPDEPAPAVEPEVPPEEPQVLSPATRLVAMSLGEVGMLPQVLRELSPAERLPDVELERIHVPSPLEFPCDGWTFTACVDPVNESFWIVRQGGIAGRIEVFGPGSLLDLPR